MLKAETLVDFSVNLVKFLCSLTVVVIMKCLNDFYHILTERHMFANQIPAVKACVLYKTHFVDYKNYNRFVM